MAEKLRWIILSLHVLNIREDLSHLPFRAFQNLQFQDFTLKGGNLPVEILISCPHVRPSRQPQKVGRDQLRVYAPRFAAAKFD
ncbi:hypothetical protein DC522_31760 [Microvirga sp. KLBC 81]|nr:hypothetical protein DC522_31760 [Microvirga sp. KLBC 81]